MHIVVIDRDPSATAYIQELLKLLIDRGASVDALRPSEVSVVADHGEAVVCFRGAPARADVVFTRQVSLMDELLALLFASSRARGCRICNPPAAASLARDKVLTAVCLSRAGVPVVPTIGVVGAPATETLSALEGRFGGPLVVKPATGGGGVGVTLVESARAAALHLENLSNQLDFDHPDIVVASSRHYVVQPLVGSGVDARVFVIGRDVVAMTRRTAPPTDFRTNGAFGAQLEAWWDADAADVAVRAAAAVGLEYAGVDVIPTDDGPVVLEVNGWPGYAHTAYIAGVDIASHIADLLLR